MAFVGATNLIELGPVEAAAWTQYAVSCESRGGGLDVLASVHAAVLDAGCASVWYRVASTAELTDYILVVLSLSTELPEVAELHQLGTPIDSGRGCPPSTPGGTHRAVSGCALMRKAVFNLLAHTLEAMCFVRLRACFFKVDPKTGAVDGAAVRASVFEARGIMYLRVHVVPNSVRELRRSDAGGEAKMDVVLAPTGTKAKLRPFLASCADDSAATRGVNQEDWHTNNGSTVLRKHPARLVLLRETSLLPLGLLSQWILKTDLFNLSNLSQMPTTASTTTTLTEREIPTSSVEQLPTAKGNPAVGDVDASDGTTLPRAKRLRSLSNDLGGGAYTGEDSIANKNSDALDIQSHAEQGAALLKALVPRNGPPVLYTQAEAYRPLQLDVEDIPLQFQMPPKVAAATNPFVAQSHKSGMSMLSRKVENSIPNRAPWRDTKMKTLVGEAGALAEFEYSVHSTVTAQCKELVAASEDVDPSVVTRVIQQDALAQSIFENVLVNKKGGGLPYMEFDLNDDIATNAGRLYHSNRILPLPHAEVRARIMNVSNAIQGMQWSKHTPPKGPITLEALLHRPHIESPSALVPNSGAVDLLPPPTILLGQSASPNWLSVSPSVVPLWEKLGLQPYGDFDVTRTYKYFVIGPGAGRPLVEPYLRELSHTFSACELGCHKPFEVDDFWYGVDVSSKSSLTEIHFAYAAEGAKIASQIASYAGKQELSDVGHAWKQGAWREQVVFLVYMVDPFASTGVSPDIIADNVAVKYCLQLAFARLLDQMPESLRSRCVIHRLPYREVQKVYGEAVREIRVADMLRSTAFTIFTKIRKEIPCPSAQPYKPRDGEPERLHVPLFVLTPHTSAAQWFTTAEIAEDYILPLAKKRHKRLCRPPTVRLMHVAFLLQPGSRWAAVVWTDTDGALLETAMVPAMEGVEQCLRDTWARTRTLVEVTMLPWRMVFCVVGDEITVSTVAALTELAEEYFDAAVATSTDRLTTGVVLGLSVMSISEFDDFQLFLDDNGSSEATGSGANARWACKSRALVLPEPFMPKKDGIAVAPSLGTVLLHTAEPELPLTSRAAQDIMLTSPRQCTLILQLLYHRPHTAAAVADYPLDSVCPLSAVRFLAAQIDSLSWLEIGCLPNTGRSSCLPIHVELAQRIARGASPFCSN